MSNKKRQIVKQDKNEVANQDKRMAMREIFSTSLLHYEPDRILNELCEEARKEGWEKSRTFMKARYKAAVVLGLETHVPIAETVKEKYRLLVVEVARNITREYDCKTPSEKILAQVVASEYVRAIQYSKRLTELTDSNPGYLFEAKVGYLDTLGKESDRAHRRLINAISMLKQIKNPSLVELNIKTKTAFIAQNQQINATDNKAKQGETNDHQ